MQRIVFPLASVVVALVSVLTAVERLADTLTSALKARLPTSVK